MVSVQISLKDITQLSCKKQPQEDEKMQQGTDCKGLRMIDTASIVSWNLSEYDSQGSFPSPFLKLLSKIIFFAFCSFIISFFSHFIKYLLFTKLFSIYLNILDNGFITYLYVIYTCLHAQTCDPLLNFYYKINMNCKQKKVCLSSILPPKLLILTFES